MQYFTAFFNPEDPKGDHYRVQGLLVMTRLSDFANGHVVPLMAMRLLFTHTNAKNS